ncbi:MAG: sigma-54-dependent transcriptional regulator, partial [Saprospiraceae bacterium]
MQHILIIDDDRGVCTSLKLLLTRKGFRVSMIHHPRDLESAFHSTGSKQTFPYDLAFLDMNFSITTTGKAGLEALKDIKQLAPKLPVILITGWATVQLAVEGMKLGAADFIAKPWDNKALMTSVQTQLSLGTPLNAHKELKGFDAVIGDSPAMDRCIALAKQIAPTDANVLITGESGTGQEVLAKSIHAASGRKDKAFIAVNLGGVPESLFESELFGHKAGAFTDAKTDRQG